MEVDPKIVEAGDAGVPIIHYSPDSAAAHVCMDIASRLESKLKGLVSDSFQPQEMELSAAGGRYAITAQFSDGHRTGIYTFKRLRELG